MIDIDKKNVLNITLIISLVFLSYVNTLNVPFYLDDYRNIVDNPAIRLTSLDSKDILNSTRNNPIASRPVVYLSFALNYYLDEYRPAGYHLINIFIHISSSIFLYLFLSLTFSRTPYLRHTRNIRQIVLFSVLLWALHPMQTQSVTYIVQRMNSLSVMFFICAFWLYARGRLTPARKKWPWLMASFFSWILALGSKEIAATLPFFVLLYEYYFIQDLKSEFIRKRLPYIIIALASCIVLAFLYLGLNPFEKFTAGYAARNFTLQERILTEFRVIWYYLALFFLPAPGRLSLEHEFNLSTSLIHPPLTVVAILGILLLLCLAILSARRNRLLSFSILWLLGNLFLESSFIPLEIIFEHRMHLPSIFMCVFIVYGLYALLRKQRRYPAVILTCITLIFILFTIQRNNVWGDPVAFWRSNLAHSPNNARIYTNLGSVLYRQGENISAAQSFQKAIELAPSYPLPYNNLALVLRRQGKIQDAIQYFNSALKLNPNIYEAQSNLGSIYGQRGELDKSLYHLREAVRINPGYAIPHNNLGNVLFLLGRYREAVSSYDEALRLNPGFADARFNRQLAVENISHGK